MSTHESILHAILSLATNNRRVDSNNKDYNLLDQQRVQ